MTTLEFNSFLERQLWPSFDTKASPAHLITIALLINEKVRNFRMDRFILNQIFDHPIHSLNFHISTISTRQGARWQRLSMGFHCLAEGKVPCLIHICTCLYVSAQLYLISEIAVICSLDSYRFVATESV